MDTTIVLIPKVDVPKSIRDYRPISLCNVIYKITAKVLANRLQRVLPHVISENQSAFTKGRLITDNVLVAFELIHHMKNGSGRAGGDVAIKLDISKAYDSIEWPFLEAMMLALGFDSKWVEMIMLCVRNVKYSILVNDELVGPIVPSRGLRQGDPLSPYLYILCAEGMSALLRNAENQGLIKGISIRRSCPAVSHLLFADDSFLFLKATEEQCSAVCQILHTYERASGQAINFNKSGVFFGANVFETQRSILRDILGIHTPLDHSRYLGLPSLIGSNKSAIFAFLRNKMWRCISRWNNKFLSKAGKEVLLKSVAQSIPTYSMSVFLLPHSLIDELQKMMNSFWWGSKDDGHRKVHWLRWDRMCGKKGEGGLGFRNLKCFNLAMLAKQGWRLIQNPNSLIGRMFKGRYFPNSDFLSAKAGHNPSFTWRSILQASEILRRGSRWRVGNGKTIRVWKDPWLPRGSEFRSGMEPDQMGSNLRVGDLMSSEGDKWDTEKVNATFSEEDALCIISLPIFPTREDRLIWHFDKKGIYNVRSGYFVASRMDNVSDPIPGVSWNKVWSMQIPPKVKVFLWRALRNILPTKEKLNQRGVQIDPLCGCGEGMETLDHAIMRCRCVQAVWRGWVRVGGVVQGSLQEAFAQLCSGNDSKGVAEFAMVAWAIWWARNVRVWQNSSMTPNAVLKKALGYLKEWERVRCMQSSQVQNQDSGSRGDRTQVEWLGEVDAAIVKDPEGMGSGAVFRKADGVFLKAVSSSKQGCFSPCMAEALALRDCLQMAESHLPGRGLVLSDAQSIVMAVANEDPDWSELGGVILECKDVLCRRKDIKVEWTSRSNVRGAHVLARNASLYGSCKIWGEKPPCIASLVS